ncbi:MAG TPA: peptidyl-prolyl cis-trans isomerase [Candidatus Bathyarchaeia archaeon]|nr:peptidyl-prolyl cis-trans isomerase [Candidatus Bathyarchaeia archaeon]
MKQMRTISGVFGAVSLIALTFLPSCELPWNKKEEKKTEAVVSTESIADMNLTGEPLVLFGGKAVITVDSLKDEKEKLLKSNPQLKMMMAFMDEKQLDRNLAEGLMNQFIVDTYIQSNSIDNSTEYQAELEEGYRAIRRMINTKYFSQIFPVTISDSDVKKFYDENKDVMPNLLLSKGGVKAVGISFDKESDARAFATKVKEKRGDLQAAAKESGSSEKVKDFKLVNDQSLGIDETVRSTVTAMKSFPATEVVKATDGTFWVVAGSGKEEQKYRPFDQVKDDLKQYLEKEKRAERFEQEIDRLKKEYNVAFKEDYFGPAQTDEDQMPDIEGGVQEQAVAQDDAGIVAHA